MNHNASPALGNSAATLAELGYRVFPCRPGGKTPATAHGCLDATCDFDAIGSWWDAQPSANLALSTDGLLVVDVDPAGKTWLTLERADALHAAAGAVATTPRGGYHFFFRQPDGANLRNTTSVLAEGVDTRATGGYVVIAPSRVVDAEKSIDGSYVWLSELNRPPEDLPTPPGWLLQALTTKRTTGGGNLADFSVNAAAFGQSNLDAPIPSGQRNGTLASLAGRLRAAGLAEDAIAAALLAENRRRCVPPLPDDEVTGIARSIARYPAGEVERPLPGIVSIGELAAQNPRLRPVVIDGLLRQGEICNIIAKSKVGKSWSAYGLALSVVTGRPWLDRFPTSPGRVLLIDDELHREDIAHRIPTVAAAMGLQPQDYHEHFDVLSLRGDLRGIFELQQMFELIGSGRYSLVIIDALYRMLPNMSENDNAAMAAVYNVVDKYAALTDAAFVLIHHATKGSQSGKDVTDVGAGAGAQSRAADTHIVLRPHEDDGAVVLEAVVRSFAPVQPVGLRWAFPLWQPDANINPALLKGLKSPQEERQTERDRDGCEQIVTALREHESGTPSNLRSWTSLGPDRLTRLLAIMSRDGRLQSQPITIRGNDTTLYSLAAYLRGDDSARCRVVDEATDNVTTYGGDVVGMAPIGEPSDRQRASTRRTGDRQRGKTARRGADVVPFAIAATPDEESPLITEDESE